MYELSSDQAMSSRACTVALTFCELFLFASTLGVVAMYKAMSFHILEQKFNVMSVRGEKLFAITFTVIQESSVIGYRECFP
jgi:hypothetical protein